MLSRALPVTALLLLAACGKEEGPQGGGRAAGSATDAPAWAHVSKEQIAEAERLHVPVAFENAIGMRFVLIPAGSFPMGSAPEDRWIGGFVEPQETEIESAFYLGIFEVTNAEFRLFRPDHHTNEVQGLSTDDDRQPVGSLDFEDTTAFASWLGKHEPGRTYRLPTEEEWEYACRAGTKTRYWWGADEVPIARYANVRDLTWNRKYGITTPNYVYPVEDKFVVAAPVGSFKPNPWGLFDMLGNSSELCEGRYDPARDAHVSRGGSYADGPLGALPTTRGWFTPSPPNIGFRMAASVRAK